MPSTGQGDTTFDYENSPWVGDKILARVWYEELEELNNPVLVREALRLSGGNPTSTITIDPHDIRRPVLVPRGFAQDWLAHRDARIKEKLERRRWWRGSRSGQQQVKIVDDGGGARHPPSEQQRNSSGLSLGARTTRSSDPNSLLNNLLIIVPSAAIGVWMWGWKRLAIVVGGSLVILLLLGAVLEPDPQDRVWSFFTKTGVLLFAGIGFVVVALGTMFIAGLLGVPGW